MTNLVITQIRNPNIKVSATNLCFYIVGKLRMMNMKQKGINKTPKETLITSPAMNVDKKVTMQETVNYPHRKISKRMHKNSGRQSKENPGTNPLLE